LDSKQKTCISHNIQFRNILTLSSIPATTWSYNVASTIIEDRRIPKGGSRREGVSPAATRSRSSFP
jgi:hypothetical protein